MPKSISPLAAPLFLEAGRIPVDGAGRERLLHEAADRLMAEAGLAPAAAAREARKMPATSILGFDDPPALAP